VPATARGPAAIAQPRSGRAGDLAATLPDPAELVALGRALHNSGYAFVTPTPLTHARVNARPGNAIARSLRDVFGWSRPGPPELFPAGMLETMRRAGIVEQRGPLVASTVRFSSLQGLLFAHSAYPTSAPDSVFFGPDTYRFVRLIERALSDAATMPRSILDLGCGSGAGGLVAAQLAGNRPMLVLADINPKALVLACANAALAGIETVLLAGDLCRPFAAEARFDLVVANPPYLVDPSGRTYRSGGGPLGAELSLRILRDGAAHLAPGGRLVLYTGAAMVEGRDPFREAAAALLDGLGLEYQYGELDPDVFGEELETDAYREVDRIAAVSLIVTARPRKSVAASRGEPS